MMLTAADTLEMARFARGVGDVDGCLSISEAAVRQAEFEHDPETAYFGAEVPGRMYMGRGEPGPAVAHYRYALDILLMHGNTVRLGGAYHDLAIAVRETGDRRQFKELIATSFHLYHDTNPRNPGITGLLADRACDDFERYPSDLNCAEAAWNAWRAVPASMRTPRYRLTAAAHQMRASAVLRSRARYQKACEALNLYHAEMPDGEAVPLGLAYAAGGALEMRDFRRAYDLAECAWRKGMERGETVPAEQARAVMDAAQAETTHVHA